MSNDISNDDLAPESCACPGCGERRMDHLEWTEGEYLICTTCNTKYDPHIQ